jgi:site-specific recombinase XerD
VLTKLEYRGLRDAAKEDPRIYALIELLLQTGMKIGEVAGLKINDIGQRSVHVDASGSQPAREVPLNKPAEIALKSYLKVRPNFPDPHVFITRTGKQMLIRNIRQVIDRCFLDVGIQNATVNDLRNTFIAHQLATGVSLEYIARVVGHKRLSSTERFLEAIGKDYDRKEILGEL